MPVVSSCSDYACALNNVQKRRKQQSFNKVCTKPIAASFVQYICNRLVRLLDHHGWFSTAEVTRKLLLGAYVSELSSRVLL